MKSVHQGPSERAPNQHITDIAYPEALAVRKRSDAVCVKKAPVMVQLPSEQTASRSLHLPGTSVQADPVLLSYRYHDPQCKYSDFRLANEPEHLSSDLWGFDGHEVRHLPGKRTG